MSWTLLPNDAEILPVHAAYLGATNEIIYFGGNQHVPENAANDKIDATRLFDVASGTVKQIASPTGDLFCCGHAFLADAQVPREGRLIVAGGTSKEFQLAPKEDLFHKEHFPGIRDVAIFSPTPRSWTVAAKLNTGKKIEHCGGDSGGRWYPTLLTLANGNILAMSGHPARCDASHSNFIPEVFTQTPSPAGAWHSLGSYFNPGDEAFFRDHDVTYYPRLHLLPTGDVFSSSPIAGMTQTMTIKESPWGAVFNVVTPFKDFANPASPVDLLDKWGIYGGFNATSILLPLLPEREFTPRVLICGAQEAFTLDLKNWAPSGQTVPSPNFQWKRRNRQLAGSPRRINLTAVMLPTGEVFVSGGVQGVPMVDPSKAPVLIADDDTKVLLPEIYDSFTNKWSAPNDPAQVVRNYHSVALLLPDGRVWTAGSDKDAGRGMEARELRFEIYSPWYYGNPDRPTVLAAPDVVKPSQRWIVETNQPDRIKRVAMLRCGSSTHAFDADQRYVGLKFERKGGKKLCVEFPPNNNIMVPGFYFLFLINDAGLPSLGTVLYSTPRGPHDGPGGGNC